MRWRISNIPPDIRKRARDAAKAANLPLGPWLERAIRHDIAQAEPTAQVSAAASADIADGLVIASPQPNAIEIPTMGDAFLDTANDALSPSPAVPPQPEAHSSQAQPPRPIDVIIAGAIAVGVITAACLWLLPLHAPPSTTRTAVDRPAAGTMPTANDAPEATQLPPMIAQRATPPPPVRSPTTPEAKPAENAEPPSIPPRSSPPAPSAAPQPRPGTIAELQRDALNGDAMAQHDLALAYVNGRGVPQNYEIAASWFEKAAAAGLERAQFNLAVLYENALGVPQDLKRAFELYRAAAEQGFAPAQHNVAVAYIQGRGTSRDVRAAALWFRRAADQGIASALYNLGMIYEKGLAGPADPQTAYGWYRRAAAAGSEAAVARLAALEGRIAPLSDNGQAGKPRKLTRDEIAEIQRLLAQLSFDAGPPDGKAGPATRTAIRQYEQIAGMKVTGEASVALLAHLRQVTAMMRTSR